MSAHIKLSAVKSWVPVQGMLIVSTGLLLAACGGSSSSVAPPAPTPVPPTPAPLANQLYTQSNETANKIVHFTRQSNGTLMLTDSTATGGMGTNAVKLNGTSGPDSLASQHSIILTPDNSKLLVVNAGDNSISVMALDQTTGTPSLVNRTATIGSYPNSLAYNNGVVYATFLGGTTQLVAYQLMPNGALAQIESYNLSAMSGISGLSPTQVLVSPDQRYVVVNAGVASNTVLNFPINSSGSLGSPVVNTAANSQPFASAFLPYTSGTPTYLTTGIGGVSLTSYTLANSGILSQLSQAAAMGVGAPCWLSVTPNGQYAYVGNGSGAITSYSVSASGQLTLLQSVAAQEAPVKNGVTSVAADSWISADGKYLYEDYLGDDEVVAYAIGSNGSLTRLGSNVIGTATGLSLQGLVGI